MESRDCRAGQPKPARLRASSQSAGGVNERTPAPQVDSLASDAHSINRLLATALPVNELAKVEQDMKLDAVAVACAACFSRFKTGAHEVDDAETAADVRADDVSP